MPPVPLGNGAFLVAGLFSTERSQVLAQTGGFRRRQFGVRPWRSG